MIRKWLKTDNTPLEEEMVQKFYNMFSENDPIEDRISILEDNLSGALSDREAKEKLGQLEFLSYARVKDRFYKMYGIYPAQFLVGE